MTASGAEPGSGLFVPPRGPPVAPPNPPHAGGFLKLLFPIGVRLSAGAPLFLDGGAAPVPGSLPVPGSFMVSCVVECGTLGVVLRQDQACGAHDRPSSVNAWVLS